jgi:3-phosphoglycerate kinase
MTKQTVRDIDLEGKRVLVRVDYNVPIKDGEVGDTLRIKASFETIKYLLNKNCSIVLMSHLGRPDGKVDPKLSLAPVAKKASELLGHEIGFVDDCIGPKVKAAVNALKPGEILLLENLRFHPEEEKNDKAFAKELSAWGEVYVDDAFAVIHRAHASTVGVTEYLPSVAGFLVEKEIDHIQGSLDHPNRPLAAIIGGAKVSTKIELLQALIPKVDIMIIGGAMANTFFLGEGHKVGKSLAEPDFVDTVKDLVKEAEKEDTVLLLPEDVVVSKSLEEAKDIRTIKLTEVAEDDYIVDAAPSLAAALKEAMYEVLDFDNKGTVIWNGPIGVDEIPEFAAGSKAIADEILDLKAISIIGGGDTAAYVDDHGMHDKFTWVSTGGGASLELMSGKVLPGVAALRDSAHA